MTYRSQSATDFNATQRPKPSAPPVMPGSIPAELKALSRWVCWRYECRPNANGGKWTKVPANPKTLFNAKSDEPSTWGSFDDALYKWKLLRHDGRVDGIGFMLGDGWAGIDIDNCLDADQKFIIDAAPDIIKSMNTYTEISPSRRGVKMLFQANTGRGRKLGGLECYSQGRFFTITGHHLPATPTTPQARQQQADDFLATYFDDADEPVAVDHSSFTPQPITDGRLRDAVERAHLRPYDGRFRRLWRGKWQGLDYPSQSEADCALLNYLAYELGPDPDAIDAVFRQSGLMRPKWDSKRGSSTWGRQCIDFVLSGLTKWHVETALVSITEIEEGLPTEGEPTKPRHFLPDLLTLFATVRNDYTWVVRNRLRQGVSNVIGGPSKGGKSVFTINWLIDALLDGETLGFPATAGAVLYLDYENDTIYTKQVILAALGGRSLEQLADRMRLTNLDVEGECALPSFLTPDYLDKIIKPYAQPGVIVADTIRGCFGAMPKLPPRWEDDHSTIGNLLRPLTSWCHKTGWTLNFIHHTNKAGILSGSTEIMAAVDSIWEFERIKDARDAKKDTNGVVVRIKGRMPAQEPFYLDYDGKRYRYVGNQQAFKDAMLAQVEAFFVETLTERSSPYTGDQLLTSAKDHFKELCPGENKLRKLIKDMVERGSIQHAGHRDGYIVSSGDRGCC